MSSLFQLDDPKIKATMKEVQEHCCDFDPSLKPHCDNVPVRKSHVTLLVANVQEDEMDKAKKIIERTLR